MEKPWFVDIYYLFNRKNIFPNNNDIFMENQLNSISRLIIVIFLFLALLVNVNCSLKFLLFAMLIIIISYYIKKNICNKDKDMQTREHYQPPQSTYLNRYLGIQPRYENYGKRNCSSDLMQGYEESKVNKTLIGISGPQNPRTMVPPISVAPSHDLDFWKFNNLVTHSHVNEQLNIDKYQSGYTTQEYYADEINNMNKQTKICIDDEYNNAIIENFELPQQPQSSFNYNNFSQDVYNPSNNPNFSIEELNHRNFGQVNTIAGYNPRQMRNNLPSNAISGNCNKSNSLKEYNKKLYTQTIQPGVYSRNEVNEPLNSNIGISYTQQFEPTKCDIKNGELLFVEEDALVTPPIIKGPNMDVINAINNSNVYDPRYEGYGPNERAYTERVTGQTRFMYDDVNAIRMPNYVTRSNIDFLPFADSYGPLPDKNNCGNPSTYNMRDKVQQAWLDNSLEYRTGLQERLMRKINANAWQQREKPIRTNNFMFSRSK